ncbi:MAG: DUF4397 domain-containing protein, partial [Myxococcales bacterium]|nr:DUF4397 domain-containing protein [Myxococcales bacterium]
YAELPAGEYDFDVALEGGAAADSVLAVDDVELVAGKDYTVAAWGTTLENLAAILLEDDNSDTDGNVRIRAIHAAAGVGEVDVWSITNPAAPAPLFVDLDTGDVGDALELPTGDYTVGIDADNDGVVDFGFDLPPLTTAANINAYAVINDGNVTLYAQVGPAVIPVPAVADPGFVRAAHLASGVGEVDVFAQNGADPVASKLAFPSASGWILVPGGDPEMNDDMSYEFDVSPTGEEASDAVLTLNADIDKGIYYTAYAYIDEGPEIDARVDGFNIVTDGNIRIDVVHVAPAAGEVDVLNADGNAALLSNVGFGASGSIEIPAGQYSIGLDTDNGGVPDLTFDLPNLAAGTVATAYAVSDNTGVFLFVLFSDGTTAKISPTI